MISKKKAIQIAEEWVKKESTEFNLVLLYEHTIDFEFGWVFFYQTKEYVETGDIRQMTGENAPIIVDSREGTIHVTGTSSPVEKYIRDYIKERNKLL